jgi:hypothetical protein
MEKLIQHQQEIATATVVWHELLFGCYRLPDSKRRRNIEEYLQGTQLRLPLLSYVDILAAVKRTAIPHHATFLEWSLNGVDASRDAASLTEVLRFPTRPFKVSECPPATLIFTAAFTSRS